MGAAPAPYVGPIIPFKLLTVNSLGLTNHEPFSAETLPKAAFARESVVSSRLA